MPAPAKSSYNFWLAVFGAIPSTLSIISVTQRMFNVGLGPVFQDILEYYRKLVFPLFDFVPFTLPGWYKDLYILSGVALISLVRAMYISFEDINQPVRYRTIVATQETYRVEPDSPYISLAVWSLMALVASVFLIGILLVPYLVLARPGLYLKKRKKLGFDPDDQWTAIMSDYFLVSIGLAVAAAIVFYATNAVS